MAKGFMRVQREAEAIMTLELIVPMKRVGKPAIKGRRYRRKAYRALDYKISVAKEKIGVFNTAGEDIKADILNTTISPLL
jgi:hypothetical protein